MMEQILVNLAINARDAMARGGRISITAQRRVLSRNDTTAQHGRREGDFVCLIVRDTGCGIAPEIMTHIFEPFFTTKENLAEQAWDWPRGLGCREQHGGWVEVQSEVGVGTSFEVYLPATAGVRASFSRPNISNTVRGGALNHSFGGTGRVRYGGRR